MLQVLVGENDCLNVNKELEATEVQTVAPTQKLWSNQRLLQEADDSFHGKAPGVYVSWFNHDPTPMLH